jgi:hypothetical protein
LLLCRTVAPQKHAKARSWRRILPWSATLPDLPTSNEPGTAAKVEGDKFLSPKLPGFCIKRLLVWLAIWSRRKQTSIEFIQ